MFARMNTTAKPSLISRWHHRVLGALWGLCGLVLCGSILLENFRHQGSWFDCRLWIALLVVTAYTVTGVGFISGRTWARTIMAVLMLLAVLVFLDMILMSGFTGNREWLPEVLILLGTAGYTLLFLAISTAYRCKDLMNQP
jgi:hypothetical protein